jgi:hypothetical protein
VVNEVCTQRAKRFENRTFAVLVEGGNPQNPNQVGALLEQSEIAVKLRRKRRRVAEQRKQGKRSRQ